MSRSLRQRSPLLLLVALSLIGSIAAFCGALACGADDRWHLKVKVVDGISGEPVPKAMVNVLRDSTLAKRFGVALIDDVVCQNRTDENGLTELEGKAGEPVPTRLVVTAEDHVGAELPFPTSNEVTVELDRGGTISGTVTVNGKGGSHSVRAYPASVPLRLRDKIMAGSHGSSVEVQSDEAGRFHLRGLVPKAKYGLCTFLGPYAARTDWTCSSATGLLNRKGFGLPVYAGPTTVASVGEQNAKLELEVVCLAKVRFIDTVSQETVALPWFSLDVSSHWADATGEARFPQGLPGPDSWVEGANFGMFCAPDSSAAASDGLVFPVPGSRPAGLTHLNVRVRAPGYRESQVVVPPLRRYEEPDSAKGTDVRLEPTDPSLAGYATVIAKDFEKTSEEEERGYRFLVVQTEQGVCVSRVGRRTEEGTWEFRAVPEGRHDLTFHDGRRQYTQSGVLCTRRKVAEIQPPAK